MEEKNLKAGASKVNITPPVGTYMAGFAARYGHSNGILDELYCKALILQQGEEKYALVTADLAGIEKSTGEEIRDLIYKSTGIPSSHIIIACSHTHSGPLTYLFRAGMGEADKNYIEELKKKMTGCVLMADRSLKNAYVGFDRGMIKIGVNRRWKILQDSLELKHNPEGPVNQEAGVVKIVDDTNNTIAHLVNYACHPVVLGENNLLISADYPGVVQAAVENIFGGICLFTNGAGGDINPIIHRGDYKDVQRLGMMLAGEVIKVSSSINNFDRPVVNAREKEIFLPWKNPFSKAQLKKIVKKGRDDFKKYKGKKFQVEKSISEARWKWAEWALADGEKSEGAVVKIRCLFLNSLVLVSIPGEVFVEIGLKIARNSPFDFTFILGYADGIVGYIPTRAALEKGTYETEAYIWYRGMRFLPEVENIVTDGIKKCFSH
jgi:neutral ceramidase